jgi:hypothetical protein
MITKELLLQSWVDASDRGIKLVQQTPDQVKSILILDESIEDVFYPIETMVRAIRQRFVFHFEGDRPTNRLDKVRHCHRTSSIVLELKRSSSYRNSQSGPSQASWTRSTSNDRSQRIIYANWYFDAGISSRRLML